MTAAIDNTPPAYAPQTKTHDCPSTKKKCWAVAKTVATVAASIFCYSRLEAAIPSIALRIALFTPAVAISLHKLFRTFFPSNQTLAFEAAKKGDSESLSELLDNKRVSLETQDEEGNTLLHTAILKGHEELAAELLSRIFLHPDFNKHQSIPMIQNKNGDTAWHCAVRKGILMDKIPTEAFTLKNRWEQTPLSLAIGNRKWDFVEGILQRGDLPEDFKEKLLPQLAAMMAYLHEDENKVDIGRVKEIIKSLLVEGVKPNRIFRGVSSWSILVGLRHFDLVPSFLRAGVNPNTTDPFGRTALHYAAEYGHVETVKLLLEYQANPNGMNPKDPPIALAKFHLENRLDGMEEGYYERFEEIVKLLLEKGAVDAPVRCVESFVDGFKTIWFNPPHVDAVLRNL